MHVFLLGLFVQVMSLLYNKSISLKQLIKQIEVKLKALAIMVQPFKNKV